MNNNVGEQEIGLDFKRARIMHLMWKSLIWEYLKGVAVLTEQQAVSEHECDLGKWLYGTALKKYGSIPEMGELESSHTLLHSTIKNIIKLNAIGNQSDALKEATLIDEYSNSIIEKLNIVEKKLLEINNPQLKTID